MRCLGKFWGAAGNGIDLESGREAVAPLSISLTITFS